MGDEGPRVSLCVIARDEEADLGRCLASARQVVSEIVVVDTGSTDRTVDVARAHGARVVSLVWSGDFAAARNRSLDEATGAWALVLDADEELVTDDHTAALLETALAAGPTWGWQLRVRNLSPAGDLVAYTDVLLTRLFRRRPDVRYESRIHEQVTPSILRAGGRVEPLDVTILHHGYARTTAQGQSRAARNAALLEQLARERPEDAYVHYQWGCALQAGGALSAAETTLQRARALQGDSLPTGVESALLLRLAQLALGRRAATEARTLAEASLKLDGANTHALHVLAVAAVDSGDLRAGYAAFVRLRARPDLRPAFAARIDQMVGALAKALAI